MESDDEFSVTRRRDREAVIVAATGDVDLSTVDAVRDELRAARRESDRIVLDLRAVTFMDSSGLRLLVELQRDAEADGFRVVVVRGPASLQRLLQLSGLEHRIRMVDDLEQAVAGDETGT